MATNTRTSEHVQSAERSLQILRQGEAQLSGLFRLGSNETFLCELTAPLGSLRAVYKPAIGERPLWDFPFGSLGRREAAAFVVSRALGWDFVPPTVFREEGPLGPGSFQEYLELQWEENYFFLREYDPDGLRRVAAFDVVINNADRKAMHIARDSIGRIWLIDHGVCFHAEWKLRTVVWDFAGEDLPAEIRAALARLFQSAPGLRADLGLYLGAGEIGALEARIKNLLTASCFPEPGPGLSVPWPIWA